MNKDVNLLIKKIKLDIIKDNKYDLLIFTNIYNYVTINIEKSEEKVKGIN